MKALTVLFCDAVSALGCSSLFSVQFVLYSFTASLLCVCVSVLFLLHTAGSAVKSVVLDGSHMPEIDYTVVYVSGEH